LKFRKKNPKNIFKKTYLPYLFFKRFWTGNTYILLGGLICADFVSDAAEKDQEKQFICFLIHVQKDFLFNCGREKNSDVVGYKFKIF
jgi:hypothetical protein